MNGAWPALRVGRNMAEAADEIVRLQADNQRLRGELTLMQNWRNADVETFHDLAAEVVRLQRENTALRDALTEIAGEGCSFHNDRAEPWLPAVHGTCQKYGRTELRDERGGYISSCHACFAARVLVEGDQT